MSGRKPAILGGQPAFERTVPIARPLLPSASDLQAEIQDLFAGGMLTKGKHLRAFEEAVAAHLGVRHAVAVSSGTSGLMLAYQALGLKGTVVIPSFTFMATASALVWAGLRPVFAEVDPATANLDPSDVEASITPGTAAIVAVHAFGNPADMDALQAIADRHGLKIIYDAAHGFGALHQGRPVGSQGDAQVYSLSPTKLLVAGEGGIVATNHDEIAERVRIGREYGNSGGYDSAFAGINARMPEFNALLGRCGLERLEAAAQHRNRIAERYRRQMGRVPGIGFQEVRPGSRNAYKDFSITVNPDAFGLTRDELARALAVEKIDTRKYYDPPVHRQTAYRRFDTGRPLRQTDWLAGHSLSLPMWSDLPAETADGISQAVERIHRHAEEIR